jgi:hypothetical protein
MPPGYVGFSKMLPAERAETFYLLTALLNNIREADSSISCAQYGDHEKNADCDHVLTNAVRALRELESHLRTKEDG